MPVALPERPPLPAGLLPYPLPVERVLYEAGEPIVYVTRSVQGQQLLAYASYESSEALFTILAPISTHQIDALERGHISVRDALLASWVWLHENTGERGTAWGVEPNEIPDDYLPVPGTPLLPEHEPVLRTRAVGEQIVMGRIPAGVVAFVADATRKAIKGVLDLTYGKQSSRRPSAAYQALYDLPVQRVAFASFELQFGAPDEGMFAESDVENAVSMLEDGLVWAGDPSAEEPFLDPRSDEYAAILNAAFLLTPPESGPIREVHVSGQWIRNGHIKLTRASRRKVRGELDRIEAKRVFTHTARIGEVDVDRLSMILRDIVDRSDHRAFFHESELDNVQRFMREKTRVFVRIVEERSRWTITDVVPTDEVELNAGERLPAEEGGA